MPLTCIYPHISPNRGRRIWKCKYCFKTQIAGANAKNKEKHLLRIYKISKHRNKVPINLIDKHIGRKDNASTIPIRETNYAINLITIIHRNPFTKALIYFAVICQVSFFLVISTLFIEFLKNLYPAIEKILLFASNIVCKYILEIYTAKKQEKV